MSSFPINWKTGGISWGTFNGVASLYICIRFGDMETGRRAKGLIIRFGKPYGGLSSWPRSRLWLGFIRFQTYGKPRSFPEVKK